MPWLLTARVISSSGGRSNNNFCLIKYYPDGEEFWDKPLIYDGGGDDGIDGIAIDLQGNIIVTGYSEIWHDYNQNGIEDERERNIDYLTIKYDPQGNELWRKTFDRGGKDGALEVVLSQDSIIVTGYTVGETKSDYGTIKYDPEGNEIWKVFYHRDEYDYIAYGAAVDSAGNIIVTGCYAIPPSEANPTQYQTYTTIKYSANGTEVWGKPLVYDGTGQECAYDVATDSQDNIIVTGGITDTKTWNWGTIKYDAGGSQIWFEVYDGLQWDVAQDVAIDSADNIIVCGSSHIFLQKELPLWIIGPIAAGAIILVAGSFFLWRKLSR